MPFDELRRRALEALGERREAYRSAVATAVDEVRALLAASRAPAGGRKGERAAAELGVFAAGRIDTEHFEALFSERQTLDADALERIEEALQTLTEILQAGDALHTAKVHPGGDLRDTVRAALGVAGRAFGAGRAVESARSGTSAAAYREGFSPDLWNRAEQTVAPPLVVEVDGADLRPAGLADYLEGAQAIVLLVRKPTPPAALARLIAPGTLVVQDTVPDGLEELRTWDGPAVLAVLPEGAAAFRYRPEEEGAGELAIESAPAEVSMAIGAMSAARQSSDLRLLRLLEAAVAGPVAAAASGAGPEAADPTDRLAAWLLRQATIPGPGEA
ncbi:MAG TPA: hypothetical protein VMM12_04225 [Longimicrobiales bacterium]|nr:hypothetical protein [Longimicrobiales bacterium]